MTGSKTYNLKIDGFNEPFEPVLPRALCSVVIIQLNRKMKKLHQSIRIPKDITEFCGILENKALE